MIEFNNIKILGISSCVPENLMDLKSIFKNESDVRLKKTAKVTGIDTIRMASSDTKASDLCISSAEHLIKKLNFDKQDIDAIVFVSQTRDYVMPQTSFLIRKKLGLKNDAICFDLPLGCTGFVQGLFQSSSLLQNKKIKNVLLLCGDTITQHLNEDDFATKSVFGDAGSSCIISSADTKFTTFFDIKSVDEGSESLMMKSDHLFMDGFEVFKFVSKYVSKSILANLKYLNQSFDDFENVIFHQANEFIIKNLNKTLKIDDTKSPIVLNGLGNTGSASIPLALSEKFFNQKKGHMFLCGFGVGLSYANCVVNLSDTEIFKTIIYNEKQ